MRPLIVGEANPYGPDPRMALFPAPEGSAGHRLATVIMGLRRKTYLDSFDRANLCVGDWNGREARRKAQEILNEGRELLVLCGARVVRAFDCSPASAAMFAHVPWVDEEGHPRAIVIPHPSGRCLLWNREGAVLGVRNALAEIMPEVPFGEIEGAA